MIDLPLVSLDLEILDTDAGSEIIEVGAVKFRGAETLDTFSALVRPKGALTFKVGNLTGLTARDLANGESLRPVLERLSRFIGGATIVGQSIGIDLENLKKAGLDLANRRFDTFELAVLLRPGLKAYDLGSIARDLGVGGDIPHRALADAELARAVFNALVEKVGEHSLETLSQVVRLATTLDWPLKTVFELVHQQRVRRMIESRQVETFGGGPLDDLKPPAASEPVEPDGRFVALNPKSLASSMAPGGEVARSLRGYEDRPAQRRMLQAVATALNDGDTLLVEAGTGTGKSLAYLLPALRFAVENGMRVVVSTNTINLQDQLLDKDVPDLLHATGLPARVSVLKGRGNYLCLRRWLTLFKTDDLSPGERMLLIRTLIWLTRTTSGDRAELRLTPEEDEAWSKVAAAAEVCSPLRCPYHREGTCFVARARRAADSAHVVIVNHSLLLSDVVTGNQVLPEYRHLIVDEAHHLEDEATAQLSRRVTAREVARRLGELADAVTSEGPGLLNEATGALVHATPDDAKKEEHWRRLDRGRQQVVRVRSGMDRLFGMLSTFTREQNRRGEGGPATVRLTRALRSHPLWSEIDILWGEVGRDMLDLQKTVAELIAGLDALSSRDEVQDTTLGELTAQGTAWEETRLHFTKVIAESSDNVIAWLTFGQTDELGVNAAPLDIGPTIREQLVGPLAAAVLTSATLTSEGNFRYVKDRLSLQDAEELTVGSPFNYATSTLVYLPTNAPEPNQQGYQRAVEQIVLAAATELKGRTMVLFTSHSQLRATYMGLRDALDARKIILLGQRVDGSSRARLLETFKSGRPCVLLGTSSFWEGVDVVGEALSCLIIARLPFAPPTDPIVEARSEQFDDPFNQYSLPQAILKFRQGFGRLIRSKTDRGIMIVLDSRLRTRRYGRSFLDSLPSCEMRVGPSNDAGRVAGAWMRGERDHLGMAISLRR
ncbi:MAG: DEAD/DEAH box helicase family protein [Chloroflexi bacterium]|nr:DEAD/DEAH box helicase family protein [Chloroflexota bacterium]